MQQLGFIPFRFVSYQKTRRKANDPFEKTICHFPLPLLSLLRSNGQKPIPNPRSLAADEVRVIGTRSGRRGQAWQRQFKGIGISSLKRAVVRSVE